MKHFDEHIFQMGWFNHQLDIKTLRIQACPKKWIYPTILWTGDGMFRPTILIDREGWEKKKITVDGF